MCSAYKFLSHPDVVKTGAATKESASLGYPTRPLNKMLCFPHNTRLKVTPHNVIKAVPDHMALAWASYRPMGNWEDFKAGFGLRYIGETWDGADGLSTDPFLLADAMIGYET